MKKFLFITLLALIYSVGGYAQDSDMIAAAKKSFSEGKYGTAKAQLLAENDPAYADFLVLVKTCEGLKNAADEEYKISGYSEKSKEMYQAILEYNPNDPIVKEILARFPAGATYVEETNGLNMKMIFVEGGTFKMGAEDIISDKDLHAALRDAHPQRSVTLSPYYIGETEVTQAQWKIVMGTDIKDLASALKLQVNQEGDNLPIYHVTWEKAKEFCDKLSVMTGKKYVLPTEAQWEYAARGGNKSRGTIYSGANNINGTGYTAENSGGKVFPVTDNHPNELGIYNMSGNVQEWCNDWYKGEYNVNDTTDPQGPAYGDDSHKVYRGGDIQNSQTRARVDHRLHDHPATPERHDKRTVGFRVACLID
ncbi:MAG: SUMF1/EgtB/PvdO family nonheme iron enzyme [Alistipes sp.]|nr:SUMF1/EgtB/PvdO family nonheme iron enzyme [Alistipes sp.]